MGQIAYTDWPQLGRPQKQLSAAKPGEIPEWRRLKLKGKLWRYLWKAHSISPYRSKRGWNS